MFSAKKITLSIAILTVGAAFTITIINLAGPSGAAASDDTQASSPKASAKTAPADKKEAAKTAAADKKEVSKSPEVPIENVVAVSPDDLVKRPHEFLGKNVKFNANFFGFSTLALDYKPALKPSKTYLSLLVLAPGSHIPLSELKLAMLIPKEKDPETDLLSKLKDGDQIEIIGKEFSTALDDPWVEVLKLKKIGGSKDEEKKVAESTDKGKPDAKSEEKPAGESKTDK